jgi:hypothetical protein
MESNQQKITRYDGGLTVTWTECEQDIEAGTVTFRGPVTATYDQTAVICRILTLDSKNRTGHAEGGVQVRDPEGFFNADQMDFNWEAKTGFATKVEMNLGNARVWVDRIDVEPGKWVLANPRTTLSRRKSHEHELLARLATIYPGKRLVLRDAALRFFGLRFGDVPFLSLSLDRRVTGWRMPSISNKRGEGFGLNWEGSFLLNDQAGLNAFVSSFPKNAPGYGLQMGKSWIKPDETITKIVSASDLGERFGDGWFDCISVSAPEDETELIGAKRKSLNIGTAWNQSTTGRPQDSTNLSKAWEVIGEAGGTAGSLMGYVNARYQSIRPSTPDPFIERFEVQATIGSTPWHLTRNFDVVSRLDGFGTANRRGTYGWVRGLAGLQWRPNRHLSLGAAYITGGDKGTPDFGFDPLYSESAFHVRADLKIGPYTARYLAKYDTNMKRWYDQEYEFALVMESFEPFVVVRGFPSDFRIGFRFRLDSLVARLQRRAQNRVKPK